MSGPSGNQASTTWFHISWISWRSVTTSAVPATETHSVRWPKETFTAGLARMWATCEVFGRGEEPHVAVVLDVLDGQRPADERAFFVDGGEHADV